MNNRRFAILICVVMMFSWLAGCTADIPPPDDGIENESKTKTEAGEENAADEETPSPTAEVTEVKPDDNVIESSKTPINYADLYKNEKEKTPMLTGKQQYKASDGYTLTYEQGYNGFYYEYVQGNAYNQMTLQDNAWAGGEANISGGVMNSSVNSQAVRAFRAPVEGDVVISGNPRIMGSGDGAKVKVRILLDNTVLWEADVSDDTGVWHELNAAVSTGQTIRFTVSGASSVYWNPTVDYTGQTEQILHHAADGYFGDVHPFYDEENHRMYMFYLSTGNQKEGPKSEIYSSLLSVSDNFINYKPQTMTRDPTNPPLIKTYCALGVIKDKDGNYRSSFGYGSFAGTSLSNDLLKWQSGTGERFTDDDGSFKHKWKISFDSDVSSGRDPDLFYDAGAGICYCVVMNYYTASGHNGPKGLALYTAAEDGKFSPKATKLLDFTGRGDPECPQLKKIGNRWYLFYSVYGTGTSGGVGWFSYRIGDAGMAPQDVDWNAKTEYALDGGDVHAAQICEVGDKYYMYGWIGYEPHANVWGGYLNLPREVYQEPDGLLKTRPDPYFDKLLNNGLITAFQADSISVDGNGLAVEGAAVTAKDSGTATLNGSYHRNIITAQLTLPVQGAYACLSVSQRNRTYYVGVVRQDGKAYLAVTKNPANPFGHVWVEILDNSTTAFDLQVTTDGPFIEVFVNGEYSLTAHIMFAKEGGDYSLGLSLSGSDTAVNNTRIYKLASLQNIFD